ncbi:MAG: sugar phosphate isomerase/epimerase [Candidatus Nezhaarchaeota archaeon]|nr:sugar phosphate isomerase/epimerase [Candidatus Nezhaarchaeota archaeon]
MDIYLSSLAGILRPLTSFIVEATKRGFKKIEVVDEWGHALNVKRLNELISLKLSYSLDYLVHAPFDGLNIATPQRSLRKASLKLVKKSMHAAHELEAKLIVVHPGFRSPLDYVKPETTWGVFLEVLKLLDKEANDLDIHVGVENMPLDSHALLRTHKDALRLLGFISSLNRVRLTLDLGHSNTVSADEVKEFISALGNNIIHVHVHDNNGKIDEHLPVGSGTVNWEGFAGLLSGLQLVGGLTLEVMSVASARDSAARLIEALR